MKNLYLLLLCLVLVISAGCANITIPPYGYVSADREPFSPNLKKAILPAGAPSLSQGYKPESSSDSQFGSVNGKQTSIHEGIDILDDSGTPVLAAAAGIVESSTFGPLYGNQIVIAHGVNEDGLYYKTKYFHLKDRYVKEGDHVVRGQQIGALGMTGFLSAGFAHLHFEVRTTETPDQRLTQAVHPHKYWYDGKGMVTCFDKDRELQDRPFRTTYPVPCTGVRWKDWAQKQQ